MRFWFSRYFNFISLISCFLLYWIFGQVIMFLIIIGVIGFFVALKLIYRFPFIVFDIIIFGGYLFVALICLLFIASESFRILIMILGIWYVSSFFINKRF